MTPHRILIIDDTPVICKSLEDRLRSKRHSVTTCSSLGDAEKKLVTSVFDLIFLDVELPDGDGRDLLERIGEISPRPLVIMITANEGNRHKAYAETLGVDDYIRKPFAMDRLLESVTRLLK